MFLTTLPSPLGDLTLASDGTALLGLWLPGQTHFASTMTEPAEQCDLPVFRQTEIWLEDYFRGNIPGELPPIRFVGTPFQLRVWEELKTIPYGETITYGELAKQLNSSPRAVGGAVGRNPVSILIPCHRVIGQGGALTGYAGGLELKTSLLKLEGILE